MTNRLTIQLIEFLKARKGRPVTEKELEKKFTRSDSKAAGGKKARNKRIPKGKAGRQGGSKNLKTIHEVWQILEEMRELGLVNFYENRITPAHPFAAELPLSVARSGVAFAGDRHRTEVFIPPPARNNARHRDRVLVEVTGASRGRFEGRILKVTRPFSTTFIARVLKKVTGKEFLVLLPDLPDSPYGIAELPGDIEQNSFVILNDSSEQQKVKTSIPGMRGHVHNLPAYTFEKRCNPEDISSDIERIKLKYQLPGPFNKKLIPSRKELKQRTKHELKNPDRKNLTKLFTCTIDGKTAKDFDDAISIETTENTTVLYVHIADVAFYVEKGSPLEEEALRRGNSYYLPGTVIPMLPEILSEEFCSLRPKTKRLAFTAEVHFDDDLQIIHKNFYRSVIYINRRYTYEDAEKILDRKNSPLQPFMHLAENLLQKRKNSGRIDLDLREMESVTDSHGRLISLVERKRLRSHRLIEECMLSANTAVAAFARENRVPMLHRVHEPIDQNHLEKINAFLELYGFNFNLKSLSYDELKKANARVSGSTVENIFHYLLLRSFTQAFYGPEPGGHWGLAFAHYTHFTSPIRRFSDLVVHHQLAAFLTGDELPYNEGELSTAGRETSRLERIAMEAERGMQKLMFIRYMKEHTGKSFEAFLTGFNNHGLFITLEDPPIEGFVPVDDFSQKGETLALDDFRVVIEKYSRTVALGARMKVTLEKSDWENMQLYFHIETILS